MNENTNEQDLKQVKENLFQDYTHLYQDNTYQDFSIFVGNPENRFKFQVHKSILSVRTGFFKKYLKKNINQIYFEQFNRVAMKTILDYIYLGDISFLNEKYILELFEISICFEINLLTRILEKEIIENVNKDSFLELLIKNRFLKSQEIENKCWNFIRENFTEIKEYLMNLNEKEMGIFIEKKQENNDTFDLDFFDFLNRWTEKKLDQLPNQKEQRAFERKRFFRFFFSRFDKDSVSKEDFEKLQNFNTFPKTFLITIQKSIIELNEKKVDSLQKDNEMKIKEMQAEWQQEKEKKENEMKERESQINLKDEENQTLKKEIEQKENDNEELKKQIKEKMDVNENLKKEFNEKWEKEIGAKEKDAKEKEDENITLKNEIENKWQKQVVDLQKELENVKSSFGESNLKFWFHDSEIVKELEDMKKLQEWINDNDFLSKMKKGFSAKRDGFDSKDWHKTVDNKGKTLVIIKTKDNFIFGGFTQVGWTNDKSKWREKDKNAINGFIPDPNAFIFSLRNDKNDRKPGKYTIRKSQEQFAIYYRTAYGPNFGGGGDFWLYEKLQPGYSDFGLYYNLPDGIQDGTNESKSYLAGSFNSWQVEEVESYFL
ncbi:hypothetical protein M0811_02276 [Anaeramoeba ignava]|uniref:BTB domain-containing protein n=1 Tax=Anaeramoeba ignava TaxID=1746090 RepID=A0A9Q0R769_ANAIG|nr:hypothetical protein M0811_02276 [Anaeramoeba ignava]